MNENFTIAIRADNQGNQNEGQAYDTIITFFVNFQLLIETRKATSFTSLQVKYKEVNQVPSKYQMNFSDKKVLNQKSEYQNRVLHI